MIKPGKAPTKSTAILKKAEECRLIAREDRMTCGQYAVTVLFQWKVPNSRERVTIRWYDWGLQEFMTYLNRNAISYRLATDFIRVCTSRRWKEEDDGARCDRCPVNI